MITNSDLTGAVPGAFETDEQGRIRFLLTDLTTRVMSNDRLTNADCESLRATVATIAETIENQRPRSSTEGSLAAGPHGWAKKIVEEAYELGLAIETQGDDQVIEEAQQLIYRILVGVMGRGVHVRHVLEAL